MPANQDHNKIVLSPEDEVQLAQLIANPPAPSDSLKKAFQRARESNILSEDDLATQELAEMVKAVQHRS